uniref:Uncharacterized protein n=1 Tax=Anguilla anguilla TaxID=7936 RepID=A0A0E9SII6_ANGAN
MSTLQNTTIILNQRIIDDTSTVWHCFEVLMIYSHLCLTFSRVRGPLHRVTYTIL